jgi:hypothetical protein
MKDPYENVRDQFLQELQDFWSGKRKNYPELLADPLYIDPKLWGPEPDGGKVHKPLTKAQRQEQHRYRQKIVDEYRTQWGLLCLLYGMDPVMPRSKAEWQELCRRLAARHVPGLKTTNIPPQPRKRRGAPSTRGLVFIIELVEAVNEARTRVAKTHDKAKVSIPTALQNLDRKFLDKWKLLDKWKTGREKLLRSLETRHSEAMKMSRRARRMGLPTLEDLGKPPYKNSETD